MGFLSIILGLVDPISKIADKIAQYKIEQLNAETNQEKIHADERIKALEARRDVMVAEASNGLNAFVRACIAMPFVVYLWKLVIWDKVLSLGATDDLSNNLWYVMMTVIGFYFVSHIVHGTSRIIKRS